MYATIYEEAQGIVFVSETTAADQSMNLGGRNGHVYSCLAVDDGSERIFFYDKTLDLIGYSSFADDGVQDVIFGTGDVLAIDYDEADDKIVFSNASNQVWLYNGDGSVDRQLATAAGEVTSVQYYAAYKKVYFVANETIWSVNVDGSGLDDMLVLTGTGVTDLAVEADQTIPTVTSRYPADGQTGITLSLIHI